MNFFQIIWRDIKNGQNIDIYVTVTLALLIAILGVFNITDQTLIFSAVLATIALVSTSLLISRRENEETRNVLSAMKQTQSISDQFFKFDYSLDELIRFIHDSRKVYFLGTTLSSHVNLLKDDIKEALQNGLEMRILLSKPDSSAIRMAAFRGQDLDEKELNSDLERNISILIKMALEISAGKLEIRVVDYLAPYTMYVFDPHLSHGHLLVRLSTFRLSNIRVRPTFTLTFIKDKIWFGHFVDQYEMLWKASTPY